MVALVHALPLRGPRAERIWQASAGLSARTVAFGGRDGSALAELEILHERVRGEREGAGDLAVGGGAIGDVEVVDDDTDLAIERAGGGGDD